MAKKDVTSIVSGAGALATFATAYARAVMMLGGTEENIYLGLKNEALIHRYAMLVTTKHETRPQDYFTGYRSVCFTAVRPGVTLDQAIEMAIQLAAQEDIDLVGEVTVQFSFNGKIVTVNANADRIAVKRDLEGEAVIRQDPRIAEAIRILRTGGQRQDSMAEQLEDVLDLARAAGCYDALEFLERALRG